MAEKISTKCTHCDARFKVNLTSVGQKAKCSFCEKIFVVENLSTQPKVFKSKPRRDEKDCIAAPTSIPSFDSTPQKAPTDFSKRSAGSRRTTLASSTEAPSYWALQAIATGHVAIGFLALIGGAFVILVGATRREISMEGRLFFFYIGGGVIIYGIVAIAIGQALSASRDIAINSFLAVGR